MRTRRTLGYLAVGIALLVLAAVPLWGLGPNERGILDHRSTDSARSTVVGMAEEQSVDLTTVDTDSVEDRIDAMVQRSTGDFKRQLAAMYETFSDLVKQEAVSSSGEVAASAVSSITDSTAEVMVVVSATVRNTASEDTETRRSYRVSVELQKVDGDWKVSNMGFVQ